MAWAASKDRVVIYQGVSLDALHPYGCSSGGITDIWRHLIEPLVPIARNVVWQGPPDNKSLAVEMRIKA